jgi:hypothetical protein
MLDMACRQDPEAIRKLFRSIAARSRSILAVMKHRAAARNESVQHKMYMTELDHGSTGFYTALLVLTVPSILPTPGVCLLNHPAFSRGVQPFVPAGRALTSMQGYSVLIPLPLS